jgi:hypothetical protein
MTLEETLTQISELLQAGRAVNWAIGDAAAEAVRDHGRGIIGKIAETAGCSRARVNQMIAVAVDFAPEQRHSDIDWSIYRQVRQTAKRLGREPVEVLREVVDGEMSLAEIAAIGKDKLEKSHLRKRCEWCNTTVDIAADGGMAGTKIYCPVCAAEDRETLLGVME